MVVSMRIATASSYSTQPSIFLSQVNTCWNYFSHAKVKVAQVCLGGKAAKRGEGAGIDTEVHQHVSMHKPQLELNHTGSSQPLRRRPSSRALACRAPLWTDRRLQLCELAQPALALELRAARVEAEFERVDARLHPLHHLQLLGLHACLCPLVRLVERRDPAQHRSLQSSLEAHMQLFLLLLLLRQPRLHPLLPLATRVREGGLVPPAEARP
mmetsp:Transcript_994/g.2642  ORF Transcript_994/g.2642 Transcript_994/m.2642 type:complete len:212 (-) Transcript_994:172-807(-)